MSELIRKNIRMSKELADYFETKAKDLGISQSNLMVMALSVYKDQQKSLNILDEFKEMMKQQEHK